MHVKKPHESWQRRIKFHHLHSVFHISFGPETSKTITHTFALSPTVRNHVLGKTLEIE